MLGIAAFSLTRAACEQIFVSRLQHDVVEYVYAVLEPEFQDRLVYDVAHSRLDCFEVLKLSRRVHVSLRPGLPQLVQAHVWLEGQNFVWKLTVRRIHLDHFCIRVLVYVRVVVHHVRGRGLHVLLVLRLERDNEPNSVLHSYRVESELVF